MITTWTDRTAAHVSQEKKTLIKQEENIELEIALAALELESDTDPEETDVQEIPGLQRITALPVERQRGVNCDQEYGVCSEDVSCPVRRCFAGLRAWQVLHWCCVRRYRTAVRAVRERLHDCALRVQSNARELAKQGVRMPDRVQGFLLLPPSEPEHSSTHCHHDTGRQQLVIW